MPLNVRPAVLFMVMQLVPMPAQAQEVIDSALNRRVRAEGFERSQVLSTAVMLSDRFGPRLAGSRNYAEAAAWARGRLAEIGLSNAALEPWGMRGPAWTLTSHSIELIAPWYLRIDAVPKAWSNSLPVVTGTPKLVVIRNIDDVRKLSGQLRGAILLNATMSQRSIPDPRIKRLSDAELDSLARATDAGEPRDYNADAGESWLARLRTSAELRAALNGEGVAAILEPSRPTLTITASSYATYVSDRTNNVPSFIIAREHFTVLENLVRLGANPQVRLSIAAAVDSTDRTGYNVVGEITGRDARLKEEVVMVGGHFDSWHAATGATDNAAGVSIAIEALRILKAVGAEPRRTIRIAMWDGEEHEEYSGSMGYVRKHFGEFETMALRPGHARLSAYFNIDHGTGRIRGLYMQGNERARPILRDILAPFADLGANTLTIKNSGSTDHMAFVSVGLPAFNVIQDPMQYSSLTHHTKQDVADALVEEDMKQAAVVMASLLYHVANRTEKMPRPPLPAPGGRSKP